MSFACPNEYLAQQVQRDAEKFGIPYCSLGRGETEFPSDFINSKKILITYVQKVFNGKTIFGLKKNSLSIDTIILDDSHACIDAIQNSLSISVNKDHPLYKRIIELFEDDLKAQGHGRYLDIKQGNFDTILPVPYWAWMGYVEQVTQIISENQKDKEILFVWPLLRDNLSKCRALISGEKLEISPIAIPISDFGSFDKAKQRILMSATTQDDSFFIKGFGFDKKVITDPLVDQQLIWSGEKMILMPSVIDENLNRDFILHWLMKLQDKRNYGVVALAPSFSVTKQYGGIGAFVANKENIKQCVEYLKAENYDTSIVFVNRYDGIDLSDNSCRILIIDSKPYFDSLKDRYEIDCRVDSDIINIKIAQKIEQGLGRSVRGQKDYSVIILLGNDLIQFIRNAKTQKYFSAQTIMQIQISSEIIDLVKRESREGYQIVLDLMNKVLQRDEDWKAYYSQQMNKIRENKENLSLELIYKEYEAEKQFLLNRYDKACEIIQNIVNDIQDSSEKGWYLQILAQYQYNFDKKISNETQQAAFEKNQELLKPKTGVYYKRITLIDQERNNNIIKYMKKFNNFDLFMCKLEEVFKDLTFGSGNKSEPFEKALLEFGLFLGFSSQRPDKETGTGPDNLWCVGQNDYFMFECKSNVQEDRKEITKSEADQMLDHCTWFRNEYGEIAQCQKVMIIPFLQLSAQANWEVGIKILRQNGLKKLKENARLFFKTFEQYDFQSIANQEMSNYLDQYNLDVKSLKNEYSENFKSARR